MKLIRERKKEITNLDLLEIGKRALHIPAISFQALTSILYSKPSLLSELDQKRPLILRLRLKEKGAAMLSKQRIDTIEEKGNVQLMLRLDRLLAGLWSLVAPVEALAGVGSKMGLVLMGWGLTRSEVASSSVLERLAHSAL